MSFDIKVGTSGRVVIRQMNDATQTPMALEKMSNADVVLNPQTLVTLLECLSEKETMAALNKHLKTTVGFGYKLSVEPMDKNAKTQDEK